MSKTHFSCPGCFSQVNIDTSKTLPYFYKQQEYPPKQIIFCGTCDLGIAYPRLEEDFLKSYSETFWNIRALGDISPRVAPGAYAFACNRWRFLWQVKGNNWRQGKVSILDIGAGYGYFGWCAAQDRAHGLSAYHAVETDTVFIDALRRAWSKNFPSVDFKVSSSLDEVKQKFDIIVLSHIMEHLIDPTVMMQAVHERLTNDGVVLIEVPFKDYLFKNEIFPHINFFNEQSMKVLLEKHGFKVDALGVFGQHVGQMAPGAQWRWKMCEKILYRLRVIMPPSWIEKLFVDHFRANQPNPSGVWLRVIARKNK